MKRKKPKDDLLSGKGGYGYVTDKQVIRCLKEGKKEMCSHICQTFC